MFDGLQKALSSERASRTSAFGFPGPSADARVRVWRLRCLTHSQLHVVLQSHLLLRRRRKGQRWDLQDPVTLFCKANRDERVQSRVVRDSGPWSLTRQELERMFIVSRCRCRISVRWKWRGKKRKEKQSRLQQERLPDVSFLYIKRKEKIQHCIWKGRREVGGDQ